MSTSIFHLRGTSGSGKTTVARALFTATECEPLYYADSKQKKVTVYQGSFDGTPFYMLGDYDPSRSAGGCDTIPTIKHVIDLVARIDGESKHRWEPAIIFLEGLLLSHSWGAFGEYAHEKFGMRYQNAFLDTPVEMCYQRVVQRRQSKGTTTAIDTERLAKIKKNVYDDFIRVRLCYDRVIARGGQRIDINHTRAVGDANRKLIAHVEGCSLL